MSHKARFTPNFDTLDSLRLLSGLDPVNAIVAGAIPAAKSSLPDVNPVLESALPQTQVGVSVQTDIPAVKDLKTSDTTGALNGVVPPVQTGLLAAPANFAQLGLSSLNGVVPPISSSALSQPIDFSQIDTDQPQVVGATVAGPYPLSLQNVTIGFLEVPHSDTGLGLDNNGLTSGNLGVNADAIEADLGGAGLEV